MDSINHIKDAHRHKAAIDFIRKLSIEVDKFERELNRDVKAMIKRMTKQ